MTSPSTTRATEIQAELTLIEDEIERLRPHVENVGKGTERASLGGSDQTLQQVARHTTLGNRRLELLRELASIDATQLEDHEVEEVLHLLDREASYLAPRLRRGERLDSPAQPSDPSSEQIADLERYGALTRLRDQLRQEKFERARNQTP